MLTDFLKNWSITPVFQGQIVSQADLFLDGFEWSMQEKSVRIKRPQMVPKSMNLEDTFYKERLTAVDLFGLEKRKL